MIPYDPSHMMNQNLCAVRGSSSRKNEKKRDLESFYKYLDRYIYIHMNISEFLIELVP